MRKSRSRYWAVVATAAVAACGIRPPIAFGDNVTYQGAWMLFNGPPDAVDVIFPVSFESPTTVQFINPTPFYAPLFDPALGTLTGVKQTTFVAIAGAFSATDGNPADYLGAYANLDNESSPLPLKSSIGISNYTAVGSDGLLWVGQTKQELTADPGLVSAYVSGFVATSADFEVMSEIFLNGPNPPWAVTAEVGGAAIMSYAFTPPSYVQYFEVRKPGYRTLLEIDAVRSFGTLTVGSASDPTVVDEVDFVPGANVTIGQLTVNAYGTMVQSAGTVSVTGAYVNNGASSHAGGVASFGSVSGTGTLTLGDGLTLTTGAYQQAATIISGTVTLTPTSASRHTSSVVLDLGTLTLGSSHLLDVANHDLVIRGGTSFSTIQADITAGYNGGSWNGTSGITSSSAAAASTTSHHMALGYATGSEYSAGLATSIFDQLTVNSADLIVKYTYAGDANLDGMVNIGDYFALSAHYGQAGDWSQGDFNNDGSVGFVDYSIMTGNWGSGTGSGQAMIVGVGGSGNGGANSVPEPTTLVVLGAGMPLVILRRRKTG